jgi:phospholipid transport system substrate-binding protein
MMVLAGAGLALLGMPWRPAEAQTADAAAATAPIRKLDTALLSVMRAGTATPFSQRFATLAPVIDSVFDLNAVLAVSVGLQWATLPDAEKATLSVAFRRYTVASYLASFDSYSGQSFTVSPTVRSVGNGEAIVRTQIVPASGSPTTLSYVMRNVAGSWRVVDVLADGTISRVAVQRSDFRQLLASGGVPALVAGLQRKVSNLSGGMLA